MAIYICKNWYGKDSAPVVGSWTPKTWTGLTDFEGQDTIRIFSSGSALSDRYYIKNGVYKQLSTSNVSSGKWTSWSPSDAPNIGYGRDVWSFIYRYAQRYYSKNVLSSGRENWYITKDYCSQVNDWKGTPSPINGSWSYVPVSNFFYGERPYCETTVYFNTTTYSSWSWKFVFDTSSFYGTWDSYSDIRYNGVNVWNYSGSGYNKLVSDGSNYQSPSIWTGLTNFQGKYVWRDSVDSSNFNVYYSKGNQQYMLDKTANAWTPVSWDGLKSFDGDNVWHFNGKVFYSKGTDQYELVAS